LLCRAERCQQKKGKKDGPTICQQLSKKP